MKKGFQKVIWKLRTLFFSDIDLYFYRELIPNYIFGLMFFTVLIMINELFFLAKYYFEYHVPLTQVLMLLLNLMPFLLAFSIPFAILPGYLLTMGRFSGDSEFVAMKSCGVSTMRIFLPGLIFGVFVSVFTIYFKDYVEMPANMNYIKLKAQIMSSRPMVELKEQGFREVGGFKITFNSNVYEDNLEILSDIHVIDISGRRTIEAKKGRIYVNPDNPEHYILKFVDGNISELTKSKDDKGKTKDSFMISSFRYLSINSYMPIPQSIYRKGPDTMTRAELYEDIQVRMKPYMKNKAREISNRLTTIEKYDKQKKNFEKQLIEAKLKDKKNINTRYSNIIKTYEHKIQMHEKTIKNLEKTLPIRYLMKYYDKYAMPIASFVFAVICLSIGMFSVRSGRSEGLGISIVIMLIYYGMKIGIENMITKNILPVEFEWGPNVIFFIAGSILFYIKVKE